MTVFPYNVTTIKGVSHTFITYNLNEVKTNEDMLPIIIGPKIKASIDWISNDGSSNLNTGHTHVTPVKVFTQLSFQFI